MGDIIPAAIYTDGGVLMHNPSQFGAMWSWCGVEKLDPRPLIKDAIAGGINANDVPVVHDSALVLVKPGQFITNNTAEMIAIVKALEALPAGWSGIWYSDSEVTLGRVLKNHALNGLASNVVARMRAAISRVGEIRGVLLQGHPTKVDLLHGIGKKRGLPVSALNVWCDNECKRLATQWKKQNPSKA